MNTPSDNPSDLHAWISEYYGKRLASSADLKTNACCAGGAPPAWIASALSNVHSDVTDRFYGCGYPIPHGVQGARVLDLGCGTGRDVFVLAQLVGETSGGGSAVELYWWGADQVLRVGGFEVAKGSIGSATVVELEGLEVLVTWTELGPSSRVVAQRVLCASQGD